VSRRPIIAVRKKGILERGVMVKKLEFRDLPRGGVGGGGGKEGGLPSWVFQAGIWLRARVWMVSLGRGRPGNSLHQARAPPCNPRRGGTRLLLHLVRKTASCLSITQGSGGKGGGKNRGHTLFLSTIGL